MDRIRVKVEHPHALGPEDARERVLRLIEKIRGIYASYALTHEWADEARTAVRFRFAKEGRGRGTGTASIEAWRVIVEIDADFKLPFFVPVAAAEWKVREELKKSLEETFG